MYLVSCLFQLFPKVAFVEALLYHQNMRALFGHYGYEQVLTLMLLVANLANIK